MADLPAVRVARWPGAIINSRSYPQDLITFVDHNLLRYQARDQLAQDTRVEGADTTFLTTDGAAVSSTVVQIDMAAGFGRVAGTMGTIAALDDQPIVGTSQWIYSALLDGEEPAIMADATGYHVALCLTLVAGALQLVAVFGTEAASPVDPTAQEIRDALAAALIRTVNPLTGLDPDCFLVVGRIEADRVGAAVTLVHIAAATDDDLKTERLRGHSLAAS